MTRLLPSPLLSTALLAFWLLLARSASAGQLALGLGLAVAVPLLTSNFRPPTVRLRRPLRIAHFILSVGRDVLRSNFEVAWGVLTWRWRPPTPAFVTIPLELRDPRGLAALAMVTTVVPGTVWSELAVDRSALLLHVWNLTDESSFIAHFKERYERPLVEIFQ